MQITPQIEASWAKALAPAFQAPYFEKIKTALIDEKKQGRIIYPPGPLILQAFNLTPLSSVKVVIIGQDPYHGPGQAHGLCFSVPDGVKIPPSLKNIFKEIHSDLGCAIPTSGNLESWAKQGVLLLNTMLTVRAHEAGSHAKLGWQNFTDEVIQTVSNEREGVVFLLWGRFAQKKAELIDVTKHHILKAAHPSPLSAHNGFFGCKHFSKCNAILDNDRRTIIYWAPS